MFDLWMILVPVGVLVLLVGMGLGIPIKNASSWPYYLGCRNHSPVYWGSQSLA